HDLRTSDRLNQDVRGSDALRWRWRTCDERRPRADRPRMLERATHVGRGPGCGDADDEVTRSHASLGEILHRALDAVLRAFLRSRERGIASGDDPLHHGGIGTVRRWHLGRVEDPESPGRPRADVEQSSAAPECGLGLLDGPADRFALRVDDVGNAAVFGRDEIDNLDWRGQVDVRGARIALLRDPWIPVSEPRSGGTLRLWVSLVGLRFWSQRPVPRRVETLE